MTTNLDLVTRALVAIRVLGAGRAPKAQDAADGLKTLEELLLHLDGYGAAYPLVEIVLTGAITIGRDDPSVRVLARTSGGGFTLTLPRNPRDGARLAIVDVDGAFDTNGLTIDPQGILFGASLDASTGAPTGGARTTVSLTTEGLRKAYMYRADLSAWVEITGMTLAGAFPYPAEFVRSFRYMLAVELAGDYGVDAPDGVLTNAQHGYSRLSARYVQPLPARIDSALLGRGAGYWPVADNEGGAGDGTPIGWD